MGRKSKALIIGANGFRGDMYKWKELRIVKPFFFTVKTFSFYLNQAQHYKQSKLKIVSFNKPT